MNASIWPQVGAVGPALSTPSVLCGDPLDHRVPTPIRQVLKVWSTVKIRRTRVPQNAIVPVGRPRPYSIIKLNMCFIPKASLRASSQITASSYILERHLWVNNSKPLALAPTWSLAWKQTDCITAVMWELPYPKLVLTPSKHKTFVWLYAMFGPRGIDVIQMFCVCWAGEKVSQTLYIYPMLAQCWASVADVGLTLKQHWINVSFE